MKLVYLSIFFALFCVVISSVNAQEITYADSTKLSVFVDNFENNSKNWALENDYLKASFSNGFYSIDCKNFNSNSALSLKKIKFDESKDFEIEADIKIGHGNCAIVIGASDNYNMYRIEFNDNQEFYIVKSDPQNNSFKAFRSIKLKKELLKDKFNKITVRRVNSKYYLFINERFVKELPDMEVYGDNFGFNVGLNSELLVDNFELRYLNVSSVSKVKKKQVPNLFVKSISLADENNNNCLDENEKASLNIEIINNGKGVAEDVKANTFYSQNSGFVIVPSVQVNEINAGESKIINIPITANSSILNGSAEITIAFQEKMGFPPDTLGLKLATRKAALPFVKTVDYVILTSNGTVKPGKPVIIKALIQNIGLGKAKNVTANFVVPSENVIMNSDNFYTIGDMYSGDTAFLSFEFIINKLYKDSKIPISIQLSEKTGKCAESSLIEASVNVLEKNSKMVALGNDYEEMSNSYKIQTASIQNVGVQNADISGVEEVKTAVLNVLPNNEVSTSNIDVDNDIPQSPVLYNNRYALIIGNEDYSSSQKGLNIEVNVEFAVNDAKVFKEYANKTLGIPENQINFISNGTLAQMKRGIAWLTNLAKIDNGNAELIFYYSGHGLPDEKTREAYIIPVDVSGSDLQEAIKLDDLINRLNEFPAKKVTMFVDACFSGGARNQSLIASKGVKVRPIDANLNFGNMVLFTSSSGDESSSIFKEQKHGYFTYFLLKKLKESRGDVTYKLLSNYLIQNVTKETGLNGKIQTPSIKFSPLVENSWEYWLMK